MRKKYFIKKSFFYAEKLKKKKINKVWRLRVKLMGMYNYIDDGLKFVHSTLYLREYKKYRDNLKLDQ